MGRKLDVAPNLPELCKDEATARPAKQERQKRTRFCRSPAFMPD
jgi:hypothetical protein